MRSGTRILAMSPAFFVIFAGFLGAGVRGSLHGGFLEDAGWF